MTKRMVLAAVCWTITAALGVARTLGGAQDFTVWALVLGLVGVILTGWMIAEDLACRMLERALVDNRAREDRMVERVALRLAQALREERLTSVR